MFVPRQVSVTGPYPKNVEIKLIGTEGVKLRIVLVPTSYGRPKLENVKIDACYTEGIIFEFILIILQSI